MEGLKVLRRVARKRDALGREQKRKNKRESRELLDLLRRAAVGVAHWLAHPSEDRRTGKVLERKVIAG